MFERNTTRWGGESVGNISVRIACGFAPSDGGGCGAQTPGAGCAVGMLPVIVSESGALVRVIQSRSGIFRLGAVLIIGGGSVVLDG